MIPKVIHYCWFGRGEKPRQVQACIRSWRRFCPDYKIVEWNEDNFDVSRHPYTAYCHREKKWAYLSDFVRLAVVEAHGGLYFDTDVEAVASFDDLLDNPAFYCFETPRYVATGLGFGSVAHHPTVAAMLRQYDGQVAEDGSVSLTACPALNTQPLLALGLEQTGALQRVGGALILPSEYLNPYEDCTGRMRRTANTHSIHWYSKSALPWWAKVRSALTRPFHRLFGEDCFRWLKGRGVRE
ncbi:MAG TPA: glycosyl transferase [Clostridiales bacterium]|nr:glycosyl transferase [Clostridiales bacterium]